MSRKFSPYTPDKTKIELDEKHFDLKKIIALVLLVVAVTSITYGVLTLLNKDPGWTTVEITTDNPSSAEFVLNYKLGHAGISPTAEHKKLAAVYKSAFEEAERIFSDEYAVLEGGYDGFHALNSHPNEKLTLAPALFDALLLLEENGVTLHLIAPICELYSGLCFSTTDEEAASNDPLIPTDTAEGTFSPSNYVKTITDFVKNGGVKLELDANEKTAVLCVSEEYLAFADEYDIETFVSLGWMKNAFIVDYIAEKLTEEGFTCGNITSYDGFMRNLDEYKIGGEYSLNLYTRVENTVYPSAVMRYSGKMAAVTYRDYPMTNLDAGRYYTYADGEERSIYVNPATGFYSPSAHEMTAYSAASTCAEILASTARLYTLGLSEAELAESLADLASSDGIGSILSAGGYSLINNSPRGDVVLTDLYSKNGVSFTCGNNE